MQLLERKLSTSSNAAVFLDLGARIELKSSFCCRSIQSVPPRLSGSRSPYCNEARCQRQPLMRCFSCHRIVGGWQRDRRKDLESNSSLFDFSIDRPIRTNVRPGMCEKPIDAWRHGARRKDSPYVSSVATCGSTIRNVAQSCCLAFIVAPSGWGLGSACASRYLGRYRPQWVNSIQVQYSRMGSIDRARHMIELAFGQGWFIQALAGGRELKNGGQLLANILEDMSTDPGELFISSTVEN